ncbi:MAG: hypothetical protein IK096_00790, partial [Lachnospiraceae bacterium]|nr:hypothetical protein [Lachnospiraceae bacterium]
MSGGSAGRAMHGGPDHCVMSGNEWTRDFDLSVRVRTGEQLAAVLDVLKDCRIARIYAEYPLLLTREQGIEESIKRIHNNGIAIYAALSHMLREEMGRNGIDAVRRALEPETVSGALVRNLEEAAYLKETGYPGRVQADQALAPWNRTSLSELLALVDEWTISPELSFREIAELPPDETAELVVYGRTPMMVSAGCVRRTTGR